LRRIIVKSFATSVLLRILLGLSFVALMVLMFYVYHEGAWRDVIRFYRFFFDPRRLRVFVQSFGSFAAVIFVLVQTFQVVFAPVPGEITGFVGGLLFGKVSGVVLSTIGLTLGSLLAFGITRSFGLTFVEKVVKKEYIDKFNYFVTHRGLYVTFIFFLIPGFPKDSLCYLLGLTHMRLVDFLLMNIFGRLPGTLMLTLQGNAVKEGKYQAFVALLIASIVLMVGLYLARNYMIRFFGHIISSVLKKKKDHYRYGDSIISKDVK
jgi:uncharacterized membrane protein YdjX (TVP38/TMEM64 family)